MKSDHWNFLANLLGAPGAAEPPAQTPKTEPAKAAEPAKKDAQPAAVQPASAAASLEATAPTTRKSAFDSPSAFGEPVSPGFGAPAARERMPEPRTVDPLAFTSFRDLDDDEPVAPTKLTQPSRQAPPSSRTPSSSQAPSSSNETSKPAEAPRVTESTRVAESTRSRGSRLDWPIRDRKSG